MKPLRVASLSLIAAAGVGSFIYLKQSGLSVETLVQVQPASQALAHTCLPGPLHDMLSIAIREKHTDASGHLSCRTQAANA